MLAKIHVKVTLEKATQILNKNEFSGKNTKANTKPHQNPVQTIQANSSANVKCILVKY